MDKEMVEQQTVIWIFIMVSLLWIVMKCIFIWIFGDSYNYNHIIHMIGMSYFKNCECVIGMSFFTLFPHCHTLHLTHTLHLPTCLHYKGTTMEISPWAFLCHPFDLMYICMLSFVHVSIKNSVINQSIGCRPIHEVGLAYADVYPFPCRIFNFFLFCSEKPISNM